MRARRVCGLAAWWPVGFLLALVGVAVSGALLWEPALQTRPPPRVGAASLVPWAGAVATALAGVATVRAWRGEYWHPLARVGSTAVVLASALLLWLAAAWKLLWLPV